jgi:hypothetical protein
MPMNMGPDFRAKSGCVNTIYIYTLILSIDLSGDFGRFIGGHLPLVGEHAAPLSFSTDSGLPNIHDFKD